MFQSARAGARCVLFAATSPDCDGGNLVTVTGMSEIRGTPTVIPPYPNASDPKLGTHIWDLAQEATGLTFEIQGPTPAATPAASAAPAT